jgi:predicted alpha/beta-fold hydrolase
VLDVPPFKVHPFLRTAHLQTVIAPYLPFRPIPYSAKQHVVALADGDRVVLHDDVPAQWQPGGHVALLVHGLGGSHQSGYVARAALKLSQLGVRAFRMDLRGCGAGYNLARKPVHAGRSDDVAAALASVRKLCPASPIVVVGYSMGGNLVLKMAGEFGEDVPAQLDSVVSIAPPLDLHACSKNLRTGMNRIYDKHYVWRCIRQVERRRRLVPNALHRDLWPRPRSLREFDNVFTAPLGGFNDADDYYDQASARRVVPNIRVQTLILTAVDDPIIPASGFEQINYPDCVHVRMASAGGHMGFFSRAGLDPDRRWMDWRVVDWVKLRFKI